MHPLRRHVSMHHDKQSALQYLHKEVTKLTDAFLGHTFFEIVCPAPQVLEVADVEQYASQWVDKGWSVDVVATDYANGQSRLSMRLRSYIDTIPY